jgi:hypothetical protein
MLSMRAVLDELPSLAPPPAHPQLRVQLLERARPSCASRLSEVSPTAGLRNFSIAAR